MLDWVSEVLAEPTFQPNLAALGANDWEVGAMVGEAVPDWPSESGQSSNSSESGPCPWRELSDPLESTASDEGVWC